MPILPMLSTAEVARITAIGDPVLRNLQITHCYHRLSLALAERLGREANWCTFATWASRQAGQTIRKEDLSRSLEAFLGSADSLHTVERFAARAKKVGVHLKTGRLVELMWKAADLEGAFAHSSDAVARGNLKVFAEIGHEFARFIAMCLPDEVFDEAKLNAFLDGLRPGPPPDGQESLRQAFDGYYRALFETEPKARSELLLLSNLLVGFHEQTRLQPEIVEALEAPVISPRTFTENLLRAYYPASPWRARAILVVLRGAGSLVGFDAFIDDYLIGARRQVHFLVTQAMMTIELPPAIRLPLSQDLAAPFPAHLQKISSPELLALLARIDPTPDSLRESGAEFWGDFPDRIHFIADLFRSHQAADELFDPPFSAAQIADLDASLFA